MLRISFIYRSQKASRWCQSSYDTRLDTYDSFLYSEYFIFNTTSLQKRIDSPVKV